MEDNKEIKKALEAMMYVWGSPLGVKVAGEVLDLPVNKVRKCMEELVEEYENRDGGIIIRRINGKYQFCTALECESYVAKLCTPVKEKRLSNAAMEVLAIVSYKQPVAKSEIEYVRGIKCDKVIEGLVKRNLIEEKGRGSGIGRPILYGTTDYFLEKFGITSLSELPVIEDVGTFAEDDEDDIATQQISLEL